MLNSQNMSEFKINPYEDKALLEYFSPKDGSNYSILCDSKDHAQKIKISILLDALASPIDAPELYKKLALNIFIPRDLAIFEDTYQDEEDSLGCCQSGCAGCPYFKGYKN